MNFNKMVYGAAAITLSTIFTLGGSMESRADFSGPGLSSGAYVATVEAATVNINISHDSDEVLKQAFQGESYTVLADMGDGWMKVKVGDSFGYLPVSGNAYIGEMEEIAASESEKPIEAAAAVATTDQRQNLVNFGLQFVGGRYIYGGNDPNTGADCSGFTRYVMQHGAGVSMNRSSSAQSTQGVAVSAAQIRPGDLVFYGSGSRINHVAMYIGNGQIVHASTYKTGIKISNLNYRPIVKITNLLGD